MQGNGRKEKNSVALFLYYNYTLLFNLHGADKHQLSIASIPAKEKEKSSSSITVANNAPTKLLNEMAGMSRKPHATKETEKINFFCLYA